MSAEIGTLINCTVGVMGGRPCVAGTRISVRTVALLYKKGFSAEEISGQYEHLTLAQVCAALAYYHANQSEVEEDIANEAAEYERLSAERMRTLKTA